MENVEEESGIGERDGVAAVSPRKFVSLGMCSIFLNPPYTPLRSHSCAILATFQIAEAIIPL